MYGYVAYQYNSCTNDRAPCGQGGGGGGGEGGALAGEKVNEAVEEVRKQTTRGHVYLDLDSCVFVYACKREWIGGHVRMLVYVVYTYTHVACMQFCSGKPSARGSLEGGSRRKVPAGRPSPSRCSRVAAPIFSVSLLT